jgi:DNA-3-methyladenine glycosylase I
MDSKYADYMSNEWGRAVHSEAGLFEALTLEGAQAGLSWRTILAKREAYRSAFYNFDVDRVAAMGAADIERMLAVPPGRAVQPSDSVVRHRGKLQATVANARAIQQLRTQGGLDNFLWSFVNHSPQFTKARSLADIPTTTATATKMSNQLKALGFKFVGKLQHESKQCPVHTPHALLWSHFIRFVCGVVVQVQRRATP